MCQNSSSVCKTGRLTSGHPCSPGIEATVAALARNCEEAALKTEFEVFEESVRQERFREYLKEDIYSYYAQESAQCG